MPIRIGRVGDDFLGRKGRPGNILAQDVAQRQHGSSRLDMGAVHLLQILKVAQTGRELLREERDFLLVQVEDAPALRFRARLRGQVPLHFLRCERGKI